MTAQTTRRALLRMGTGALAYGTGAAIVAGGVAVASEARGTSPQISTGLAKAIKHAEQCEVQREYHDRCVYEPASARAQAGIEALPHTSVDAGPSMGGGRVIWSTAKGVAVPRAMVAMGREGKEVPREALTAARQVVAANLRRDRAIERIRSQSGQTGAWDLSNELSDRVADAQDAVADYPAATIEDLQAKLACIVEWKLEGWHVVLLDDAKRIAGGR